MLLPEPRTLPVNGKPTDLPAGTPVAACIALANLDEAVFDDPLTINPQRPNLDQVLSFHGLGTHGPRLCPGTDLALNIGADWLAALLRARPNESSTA